MSYSNCCNFFVENIPNDNICPSCFNESSFTKEEKVVSKKSFFTPPRNRMVTVRVYGEFISFHFTEERDREFYWFNISEFKRDTEYWCNHLSEKNWVTTEMLKFILDETSSTK